MESNYKGDVKIRPKCPFPWKREFPTECGRVSAYLSRSGLVRGGWLVENLIPGAVLPAAVRGEFGGGRVCTRTQRLGGGGD